MKRLDDSKIKNLGEFGIDNPLKKEETPIAEADYCEPFDLEEISRHIRIIRSELTTIKTQMDNFEIQLNNIFAHVMMAEEVKNEAPKPE